jgi:GH15 family glucan-1,4-alpha-glucosidase
LPEAPHSGRNWDYRYCWLRDAYFVVKALNAIGASRSMEQYIAYILSIAGNVDTLAPCYGIVPSDDLTEWIAPDLKGFEGHGPVRIGNAAVNQVQHDAYGSVILAATPMFFDRRLPFPGDESLFRLLEKLAQQCANLALEPDAGIWEFRGRKRVHTHSGAMCWAGISRTAAIAARLGLTGRARYWQALADSIGETLLKGCGTTSARLSPPPKASTTWMPVSAAARARLIEAGTPVCLHGWRPSKAIWCVAAM